MMTIDMLTPRIERIDDKADPTYGKFVIEPLERGYGATLGNALRRVLLSSIPGAAITAFKVEGILHEFSTLPGVVEDTTELLLNLKEVAVRLVEDRDGLGLPPSEPRILRIDRQGPGQVTAADIETPADVEVVNKQAHLVTLDSDQAVLRMEMEVVGGKGYLPAERQEKGRRPIGYIPIDAVFTPIRRISFSVEPTRVGHLTDFDRLILEVKTNGAISPAQAISDAAKILDRYLILFFDFADQEEALGLGDQSEADRQRVMDIRIEDLDFSVRTSNCLRREGVSTVGQLIEHSDAELMGMRNFGRKSLTEVEEKLGTLGLALKKSGEYEFPPDEEEEEEEEELEEELGKAGEPEQPEDQVEAEEAGQAVEVDGRAEAGEPEQSERQD